MLFAKLTIVVLILLFGLYMVFNDDSGSDKRIIQKETHPSEIKKVHTYTDVFKEDNQVSELKKLQDSNKIQELDLESRKLRNEAEAIIKKNNLVSSSVKETHEDDKKMQKLNDELKNAQQKLEELSNEN